METVSSSVKEAKNDDVFSYTSSCSNSSPTSTTQISSTFFEFMNQVQPSLKTLSPTRTGSVADLLLAQEQEEDKREPQRTLATQRTGSIADLLLAQEKEVEEESRSFIAPQKSMLFQMHQSGLPRTSSIADLLLSQQQQSKQLQQQQQQQQQQFVDQRDGLTTRSHSFADLLLAKHSRDQVIQTSQQQQLLQLLVNQGSGVGGGGGGKSSLKQEPSYFPQLDSQRFSIHNGDINSVANKPVGTPFDISATVHPFPGANANKNTDEKLSGSLMTQSGFGLPGNEQSGSPHVIFNADQGVSRAVRTKKRKQADRETQVAKKSTKSKSGRTGKLCQFKDCTKLARSTTQFCASHGGGRRCEVAGCTKSARGATSLCIGHGGGRRCAWEGCPKSAQGSTKYCIAHGGGRRCKHDKCPKSARGPSGFCKAHGGGKKPQVTKHENVPRLSAGATAATLLGMANTGLSAPAM